MAEQNIVIILARCSRSGKNYGIRLVQTSPGKWLGTWAFPIKKAAGKEKGYDSETMPGTFALSDTFPGCPYCKNPHIFECEECGMVGCWNGKMSVAACPWCGSLGRPW
ncbi:MAG: hypothetical protein HZA50_00085 [Planctomycetes bacterium]|nr:hypothetical protein [Planctomycetota bacterium]